MPPDLNHWTPLTLATSNLTDVHPGAVYNALLRVKSDIGALRITKARQIVWTGTVDLVSLPRERAITPSSGNAPVRSRNQNHHEEYLPDGHGYSVPLNSRMQIEKFRQARQ